MRRTKGLSEIIAVVLIIAFVIATAVIVANFSSGFTRGQIGRLQREGGITVDCTSAALDILQDSITVKTSTLYVTVTNTGKLDLTNVDIVYRNASTDVFQTIELNASITSGAIKTLQAPGFTNAINRIITTTDCPGVTDAVENVSGTFRQVT
ncbi:MAG: hypothetical protein HY366_01065 [Candidatus Aenigmarchaeota archaeon]|nr:hypothetical protein [Candidatus Aenigmarchaeota archaeon]